MNVKTATYNECFNTRASVLLLCVLFGILMPVQGVHYIRFNADFSYARDFAGKDMTAPSGPSMSLDAARAWVGAGMPEPISRSNGFAPGVGVGYRFAYQWLLVDAGFGCEYRVRNNTPYDIANVKADHVDDTGEPYVGTHTWDGRHTELQHIGVHMPVMVGIEMMRIYAMAGVKANMDVWGVTRENGQYTMTGKYTRFMDEFENVAGHGLVTDQKYETSAVAESFAWDLRACAEVGYCIYGDGKKSKYSSKVQPRYYVGAFAEYAFMGSAKHYLPLLAGIRLTALLPMPEAKKCNCLNY